LNPQRLAPAVADQALREADQYRRLGRTIEHHPAQRVLVADRRDQAQPDEALVGRTTGVLPRGA
jgi:hypothetical protein